MISTFNIVLLLLIVLIDVSLSVKQSAKQVKSNKDAFSWFNTYGYNPCSNNKVQCSISLKSILEDYQERFHLKKTGELDKATKQHMNRPRCGIQDKPLSLSTRIAASLLGLKWRLSSLTYSIQSYPTQLSQSSTKNIIRAAFQAWTNHIPLEITEACSTCKPDFTIEFSSGNHLDGYPFDGVGGTLAHAFFPENGRIHFDRDETWTESFTDRKINLYLVAVHEIGHALGLEHSYNERSIMYPSYQVMTKSDILPHPDRDDIQRLYDKKQSTTQTPTTTQYTRTPSTRKTITTSRSSPTIPSSRSNMRCETFLDAAFDHPDGTFHTIEDGVLWRYLPNEYRWEDRAESLSETYPELFSPQRIVAGVYNSRKRQVVLFTNEYAYYYDLDDENYAKPPNEVRLPTNLRNSILGAIYYHSDIYIITTRTIRLYQTDNGYQRKERDLTKEFPGFRGMINTAFSYKGLHHFFTTDGHVYVWDERANTWKTKGKPMERNWFACSSSEGDRRNDYELRGSSKQPAFRHYHHHHHHYHHHDNHRYRGDY